jgi:prevent-host-death family protein
MNLSQDIHPLTDFKRNTPQFLRQLKETGNPVVLTINGKAELVVQDAASYQRLFDLAERLETIQAVKEGLASADRGEGKPVDDVFDALEKDLRRAKARR